MASQSRSSLEQIKHNLGVVLSSTAVAGLLGVGTMVVNTRSLPVAQVGVIATVQASALLISGITSVSTHLPLMRIGTSAVEEGRYGDLRALVNFALILDICAGLIAALVTMLGVTLLSSVLELAPFLRFGLALYIVPMLFSGLSSANGILRLVDRFDLLRAVEVGSASLLLLIVLALSWIDAPVHWYLAAYATIFGLNFIARYAVARFALYNRFGHIVAEPLSNDQRSRFLKFAASSSLGATIDTLRNNLDTLTVSSLFGKESVGIYAVAKQAAGSIRKFASLSTIVSFIEFSRLTARGQYAERARLFRHVMAISGVLGLMVVIAVLMLGKQILIHGFGSEYGIGYLTLVVLVISAAVQFLMGPVNMLAQIDLGAFPAMMCNLVGLVAFGLSILPLAWAMGLEGVALASVLYFLVGITLGGWLIQREMAQAKIKSKLPS